MNLCQSGLLTSLFRRKKKSACNCNLWLLLSISVSGQQCLHQESLPEEPESILSASRDKKHRKIRSSSQGCSCSEGFLQHWQNQKANHHPVWKRSENRSQIIFSHQWRSIYFKSAHLFWHECPTLFKLGSLEHAGAPGLWVFLLPNLIAVLMCARAQEGPFPFRTAQN